MPKKTIYLEDALAKFEPWLKVEGYSEGELNMLKAVLYELRFLPTAKPEYTEQDVRNAFNNGYRCGMESAQPYCNDLATDCKGRHDVVDELEEYAEIGYFDGRYPIYVIKPTVCGNGERRTE